jgi:predicted AlkP superfamily phosphohydrolase/phosphomutase
MGEVAETQVAAPRVVLVLLDGASLDVISPAVAEGRLPNFGRLLDGGASMHLATIRPTQPEPVWASVLTGKWPPKHGIRSSRMYRTRVGGAPLELLPDYCFAHALVRFGFLTEEAHLASEIRTRPLWHVLTGYGVSAGLVGLPLTHPPEPVHGFVVSDRFHRLSEPAVELDERPTVYPPEFTDVARESLRVPTDEAGDPVPAAADNLVARASALMPHDDDSGVSALFADRVHHDLAKRLAAERDVRLLAVRYQGLDAVGHYYLRFAMPRAFGDVQEDERRQFGRVLEEYYAYVDTLVGSAMATLQGDDLLLVVSGFGMEPLSPGKRLLERVAGNERFSGTHERAPDGFLLAFGSAVARGRVQRGALVDVTPTILYFLGLPVARDMDGFARTDLFGRAFTAQRTITFIPTYDR